MTNIVFWHEADNDGFASYFAAKHGETTPTVYVPYDYGRDIDREALVGANVFFCDVTPPSREVLLDIAKTCNQLVIIDHHQSAYDQYHDIPDTFVFDANRAACVLAWEYFNPGAPIPALLSYVEDRDLWKWKLPDSKAINYGLDTMQRTFEAWAFSAKNLDMVQVRGEAVLSYMSLLIERMVKTSFVETWGPYRVAVTNATCCWSEVGNALLEHWGEEADFAATWYAQHNETTKWSLRSRNTEQVDVSHVARLFGGGGHKHAAGFIDEGQTGITGSSAFDTVVWAAYDEGIF